MRSKVSLVFSFAIAVGFYASAWAGQDFLVIYREHSPVGWQGRAPGQSLSDYKASLMARTRYLESEVFGQSRKGVRTLWLVNGSIVSAERVHQLEPSARAALDLIVPLKDDVAVHLPPEQATTESDNRKYTYGLNRVRIPDLNLAYPHLDGRGVRVGILDTGIDPLHPDLKDKWVAFKDFTKEKRDQARDDHGHGSHVSGTVAGGAASGRAIGVAPGAQLVIAKVFDSRGSTTDEALLSALQWIVDPDGDPETDDGVRVSSNSWSNEGQYSTKLPEEMVYCRAVSQLRELNVFPVFPTGNVGPGFGSVEVPGACPDSIAVGATDYDDDIKETSARGPAIWKPMRLLKPEIVAPGDSVTSAEPGGRYRSRSGTSMAVPHVAGLLAILVQLNPEAEMSEIQSALLTADDLGSRGPDNAYGNGRANSMKAVRALESLKPSP